MTIGLACPDCGRNAAEFVYADKHGRPMALPASMLNCPGCVLLQRIEYSRLEDIELGGKGVVCPECLEPWQRQRKRTLYQLEDCQTCHHRKLRGMRQAGGYAGYAANAYERRHPKMTNDADSRALTLRDAPKAALTLQGKWVRDLTTIEAAQEFLAVCRHYDLDPFVGEIVPYQGRPFVTEMGWLRKVSEYAPGQMVGYESRLATEDERLQREAATGDVLAYAEVERLWANGQRTRMRGYGWVKARERKPTQNETDAMARGSRVRPVVDDPFMMAEKRARLPLLRRLFADALRGIKLEGFEELDTTPTTSPAQVVPEFQTVIEAPAPARLELPESVADAPQQTLWEEEAQGTAPLPNAPPAPPIAPQVRRSGRDGAQIILETEDKFSDWGAWARAVSERWGIDMSKAKQDLNIPAAQPIAAYGLSREKMQEAWETLEAAYRPKED